MDTTQSPRPIFYIAHETRGSWIVVNTVTGATFGGMRTEKQARRERDRLEAKYGDKYRAMMEGKVQA